jgi:hypothetical protein
MMRAWGNRTDTVICDEPLYAHYLNHTRSPHPGIDEIIAHGETDWTKVVESLVGEAPDGKPIFYQKHMAHHLLPHMDRNWLDSLVNCLLIRDPRKVLTSLIQITPHPTVDDTGLQQQLEIFEETRKHPGHTPLVMDARDILEDPRGLLTCLCEAIGIDFQERMLTWEKGKRDTDGIWAQHWYKNVENSTSFQPYKPKLDEVPEHLDDVYEECHEYYELLYQHRITV